MVSLRPNHYPSNLQQASNRKTQTEANHIPDILISRSSVHFQKSTFQVT